MTEAQIISACKEAEDKYLKNNHRPAAVRLGKWLLLADKKDYRGTDWLYETAKSGVPVFKGTRHEVVQHIQSHEGVG